MSVPVTYSYSGRQVDLELLKSVVNPSYSFQRVYPSVANVPPVLDSDPKSVTGVEKAVQRYTNLLLTNLGSVHLREDLGGMLVIRVFNGSVASTADLVNLFAIANHNALVAMATDDTDESFGYQPDDEKIYDVELIDSNIDYASATISLSLGLHMVSGLDYKYVIPIKAGIS